MKIKRMLSVILCIALLLAFCACDAEKEQTDEAEEENEQQTSDTAERPDERISFSMMGKISVDASTQTANTTVQNGEDSSGNILLTILISDAELLKKTGKTGRTAQEQAELDASPDYDPLNSYQEICHSPLIPVGGEIGLLVFEPLADGTVLPVGEYEVLAFFKVYDAETNEPLKIASKTSRIICVE